MASCEKCWSDSYLISFATGQSRIDAYNKIIEERKNNPCSEKEQAGQFWDDDNQIDKRKIK